MTIDVDPVALHAGPLMISWYGIVVAIAIFAGASVALREARRFGFAQEKLESVALWVILGGFVGARGLHVIDRWPDYAQDPLRILEVWNGGLAILGAVLVGTAAGMAAAWRAGLPVRRLSDAVAPGVILGQAIGRFACLFTGDALGRPTSGFGVTYLNPGAMAPQLGVAYEPVFLYEMAWDLGVFALLWALRGRLPRPGALFSLYLALYAAGKFALTFLRTETVWVAELQEAQLLAIFAIVLAAGWSLWPSPQEEAATLPA